MVLKDKDLNKWEDNMKFFSAHGLLKTVARLVYYKYGKRKKEILTSQHTQN